MKDLLVRNERVLVIAAALLVPLLLCAVLAQFRDTVTQTTAALVLVLVVVAVASTGSRLVGVLAALSAAAWFDFFLTEPYNTFAITDADDVEVALLLLVIGLAVTEIALWGRRQQSRASRRTGYIDGVLRVSGLAGDVRTAPSVLVDQVALDMVDVLGIDDARFVPGPVTDPRIPLLEPDGRVTRDGARIDVERTGLPTDDVIAVEVRHGGSTVGHFELTASTRVYRPSVEQRKVAVLLAAQLAAIAESAGGPGA